MRRKKNYIIGIKDEQDNQIYNYKNIKELFLDYFKNIYKSENREIDENILNLFHSIVTVEDNNKLIEILSEDDIWVALKDIGNLKEPSPDGFNALFFKSFRVIIGGDVYDIIKKVFTHKNPNPDLNETFIAQISKIHDPHKPTQFRLLSLTNVINQILAKFNARRLKPLLKKIISPHQSAFLNGIKITDNIGFAH